MSLVHAAPQRPGLAPPRHDWTRAEVRALFALPFPELMFRAAAAHRENFDPDRSADLDLAVDQDRRLPGGLRLLPAGGALRHRRQGRKADERSTRCWPRRAPAKAGGASRFCMGAAWRSPKDRDLDQVCAMVEGVKALGLETCATLGMLTGDQAQRLQAGRPRLLQPQPRHLAGILRRHHHHAHLSGPARHAGACARGRHQCLLRRHRRHGRGAGGPRRHDRDAGEPAGASRKRADQHAGAGRRHAARRTRRSSTRSISCAPSRWRASCMPASVVRLSAGREDMSEETQALCFLAGANSIFYGPKLLTTPNPGPRPRHGAAGQSRHAADGIALIRKVGNGFRIRSCANKRAQAKFRTSAKPANSPPIENATESST